MDVRFPHAVENRGDTTRVHLVMDLVRNAGLDQLMTAGQAVAEGRLLGYYAVHCLPASLRRRLRLDN